MLDVTRNVIAAALTSDPEITEAERDRIRAALRPAAAQVAATVSECQAAGMLGVSRAFLCTWRNGKRLGGKRHNQRRRRVQPFPFHVRVTPAGTVLYPLAEVEEYIREH